MMGEPGDAKRNLNFLRKGKPKFRKHAVLIVALVLAVPQFG
jgi:hypothetical protein